MTTGSSTTSKQPRQKKEKLVTYHISKDYPGYPYISHNRNHSNYPHAADPHNLIRMNTCTHIHTLARTVQVFLKSQLVVHDYLNKYYAYMLLWTLRNNHIDTHALKQRNTHTCMHAYTYKHPHLILFR